MELDQAVSVYVGLDVHKDSIDVALAESGRQGEVRHLGTVARGLDEVTKALRHLVAAAGHRSHVVYEAGPCGFVLQRHLAAFQEYLHAVTHATQRIVRLEQALRDALAGWSLAPIVSALRARRGVSLITAVTLVAEVQDFRRFANPRQLMAYLGLVPSEDSSDLRRRQGAITKASNAPARRALVEVSHLYRYPARVSAVIAKRQAECPQAPGEAHVVAVTASHRLGL